MSRVIRYKYGGTTKSSHSECPARVLLGGRCPKGCPEKDVLRACIPMKWVDHPGLDELPSGEKIFVCRHYGLGIEAIYGKHIQRYCDFHNLDYTIEKGEFNGEMATIIKIKVR